MNQTEEGKLPNTDIKFAFIRREPGTLYADIQKLFNSFEIKEVISHQQSESNGYITITLFYR